VDGLNQKETLLNTVYERCAGLHVYKQSVVACRMVLTGTGQANQEIRTFGTMINDLLQLSDWFRAEQVTHLVLQPLLQKQAGVHKERRDMTIAGTNRGHAFGTLPVAPTEVKGAVTARRWKTNIEQARQFSQAEEQPEGKRGETFF